MITLAIVGIIAVLTIPTLISNYKKKQTVAKLKQTYSVLSQAISMAQVNRGDMSTYDLGYFYKVSDKDSSFSRKDYFTNFFLNYIKPYVKIAKDYGYKNGKMDLGYVRGHTDYYFKLQSGVVVAMTFATGCCSYLPDGRCGDTCYMALMFWVDLNGFDPPNHYGEDIFLMEFLPSTGRFRFYITNTNVQRESLLKSCKSEGSLCGYLIFLDGWEIKDDYPWF